MDVDVSEAKQSDSNGVPVSWWEAMYDFPTAPTNRALQDTEPLDYYTRNHKQH